MDKRSLLGSAQGYTLVEMVIVMFIFAVVSAGIYTTFDTGNKSIVKQQDVIGIQQQARGALNGMERDLRTIGYGLADLGNLTMNVYPPSASAPGTWSVVESYDNLNSAGVAPSTDCIRLRYFRASADVADDVYITQDHPSSAADTFVNSNDGFHQGDLFVIYDPRDLSRPGTVLQVSNDPTQGASPKDKLIHNPGANGPYNPPNASNLFPSGGYTVGSRILNLGQSRTVTYYVDNKLNLVKETRDNPDVTQPPTSVRPIASGVEDFQIKYGFKDGQWLDAVVLGDANHDVNNLRAMRVSMVVRSMNRSANGTGITPPVTLSGQFGNGIPRGGDKFRRVVITTVISLRNLATRG
ncbi:PilW family protein [Geomonas sp. Red32]|uniref:PilW family protein n=1 Tax=Geomonas sp. Red32 TaxID=2912856 RepID=UPI00202D0CE1|nr:PilW family protein [Geomonas sp. Red32]